MRRKNSERRLDRLVGEATSEEERQGIFEIFERDEDAPLARDDEEDSAEERRPGP